MAFKTSTFTGWQLSGKDADAFLEQIRKGSPNPLAQKAYEEGRKYVEEYMEKGYFTVPDRTGGKIID